MNTSLPTTSINLDTLQVAQLASAAHQKGVLTGDWADFLALMIDEVELQASSPYLPTGSTRGKLNIATVLHKVTAELKLNAQLMLVYPVVTNETTVAFEFLVKGQVTDKPFSAQMVVFYEIENGKIKSIREYTA
jgi:ketosteroid isomerase-like protein